MKTRRIKKGERFYDDVYRDKNEGNMKKIVKGSLIEGNLMYWIKIRRMCIIEDCKGGINSRIFSRVQYSVINRIQRRVNLVGNERF